MDAEDGARVAVTEAMTCDMRRNVSPPALAGAEMIGLA